MSDVFSDNLIANDILDRLLHHSTVIPIQGTSYRIKDKVQEIETKDTLYSYLKQT